MRDASLVPSALIDAKTLARQYLSVSLATVWRMRADGKLPEPLKLTSQCVRWRRSDIESFLAGFPTSNEQRLAVDRGEASEIRHPSIASEVTT